MPDKKKIMPDHMPAMLSIFKGASINLFGTAGHLILVFGYSVFLARVLPPHDLGLYFLGFTVLSFLVVGSLMGMDLTIWRFVSLYMGEGSPERARGVVRSAFFVAFVASLIIGIVWFIGSDWLGNVVFHDEDLGLVFKIFAFALPLMVLARVFNAATQGLKIMHYQVLSKDIGEQVSKFVLSAFLLSFGLIGILFANVIAGAISMTIAFLFLQKKLSIFGRVEKSDSYLRVVAAYSLPLTFSTIFNSMLVWINIWLVGFFRSPDEVGLFSIASRVAIFGTLVLCSFNTMFSPIIADLYNRNEVDRLRILFRFVTKWIIIFSTPVFLFVVLFADPVLKLFGKEYVLAATSLIILAVGQFINSATGPVAGMVLMSGHPRIDLINNSAALALNVVLSMILIPRWGIEGAAVASAITAASVNIVRALQVFVILGISGYDRTYLKPAGALLTAGGSVYLLYALLGASSQWNFILYITFFIAAYTGMMLLLGLEDDDKTIARMVKNRLAGTKTV